MYTVGLFLQPDLKLIHFTNRFLHSLFRSICTAFSFLGLGLGLGPDLLGSGICLFYFLLFCNLFLFTCARLR